MSTEVEPDVKPPVPAWRRLLAAAGWAVLAVVAACVVLFFVARFRVAGELDRLTAELDESDPGWRWEGLMQARGELDPKENSVPRILAIVGALPRGWPDHKKMEAFDRLKPNVVLDAPRKGVLDGLLATPPVPRLRPEGRDLVRFPRGRIELNMTENPVMMLLPHHQKLRDCAQLLSLDAWDLALAGKPDDALLSARACLNVSRAVEDDPILIAALIRIAIASIAMSSAEKAMALGEPSDEALAALQKALEHEARGTGLVTPMRGERWFVYETTRVLLKGKISARELEGLTRGGDTEEGFRLPGWVGDFYMREMARREQPAMLRLMTKVVEGSRLPAKDQAAAEEAVDKEIKEKGGPTTRMLVPAIQKVAQAGRRAQCLAVAMRATIAVERYRLKNGKWPGRLEDTVPAFLEKVPEDPIDGAPIRYRRWAEGVVVYSIGNNRTDDGGLVDANDPRFGLRDFGYRLWDKDKRRAAPPPLKGPVPDAEGPP